MRIAVLGTREMVYGFKLAGISAYEFEPGQAADECFTNLVEAGDVAIIVLSRQLFASFREKIESIRAQSAVPAILPLPARKEEMEPLSTAKLLEQFLGLKV